MSEAKIENDEIVIRVKLDSLPEILKAVPSGLGNDYGIIDAKAFAESLVEEINKESETGITPFHRFFDKMIEETIDQGPEGLGEWKYSCIADCGEHGWLPSSGCPNCERIDLVPL